MKNEMSMTELLANNEETISQHYQLYADRFAEHREFWGTLAKEELKHAQLIRELQSQADAGRVVIKEKRFDYGSVKEFQRHLKEMLEHIRKNDVSIQEALQDGLAIEKLMLEKSFFEVFETDVAELKEKIDLIDADVKRHRTSIEQLLRSLSAP